MRSSCALLILLAAGVARADDVQVTGLLGTMDDSVVQRAVADAASAIQACYAQGVGPLRYVQGKAELKIRVARDGSIKRVAVSDSDLGSWGVEKCLVGMAKSMKLGKPKGGEGEVRVPLEFPAEIPVTPADADRAQADLGPKLKALKGCSGGPASFEVTVYVGPGGAVTSAGFDNADGEDAIADGWGECALAKAKGWKLTDPRGKVMKLKGKK